MAYNWQRMFTLGPRTGRECLSMVLELAEDVYPWPWSWQRMFIHVHGAGRGCLSMALELVEDVYPWS
jgi:hypothetical protein